MAEGTDNVEDRISCDDSSYSERNLEVYDSGDGVNCGSEDKEYGSGDTDVLGKDPYQFKPTGTDRTTLRLCILLLLVPKVVLIICNLRWCSFLVDPICICTHTNMQWLLVRSQNTHILWLLVRQFVTFKHVTHVALR